MRANFLFSTGFEKENSEKEETSTFFFFLRLGPKTPD